MKLFLIITLLIGSLLFSQQKKINKQIDSISYYRNLRDLKVKTNSIKDALLITDKLIYFANRDSNIKSLVNETFQLGKIYYSLEKYDDAIKSFDKSISLFKLVSPTIATASIYYYHGMCCMQKRSYHKAELSFDKAQEIYNFFKITDETEKLNLQKGIIHKSRNEFDLASTIFNKIISQPDNEFILKSKLEALFQMGTIEMAQNRNNLALNYLKKAFELNSNDSNLEQKCRILLALSTVYEKLLDKNNAYLHLKQYNIIKESIAIADKEKLFVSDYDKFKETERLKEIKETQEAKKQQQKATKFSKVISVLAIALISILSLLSLSLYKNNINRTQSNILLEEKNRELIITKEKVEKASNARAEFLSTVSHELRTPLNAINGITHLLLNENPKKSQMHYLESLKFSGNYLTNFINDILEINKIDSNKAQIHRIDFNLKKLLENIQSSLKELAFENNNNFSFKIDSEIPNHLIGDPTKLSQILLNLINNALKFTHNGEVIVTAKLVSFFDINTQIYFEVHDNGIGIPEDKIESVFDSFSQGSIDINRKYGGTGLGLTIVKKLVSILGGEIKLKSNVNKGSSFSFEIPFKIGKKPQEKINSNQLITTNEYNTKKILVIEDNKINQMITKKMLENKGIQCEIIETGEESIEKCKNNKYDLILMDIHLPGINGTIATKQIREFNTTTPIVAITAISLNENRQILMSFGMSDVITKPFIPEDFYSTISKYI
jgi:signal transduction histidine kinase/CheY-like chemotaxis protein